MKSRTKVASIMLLCALMLSLVPAAVPQSQASAANQAYCDWAQFIADVTIPDGTQVQPGATFTKTWRLKNIGYCTWTTSYTMVYDSGTQMGNTVSVNLPNNIAPGQTVDVSVNLVAPSNPGSYRSYWMFKNASGSKFGIGYNANKPWWVEIVVPGGGPGGTGYDFAAKADSATWSSGAGTLTFPGTQGDARGYAIRLTNAVFESGATASQSSLLMSPQQVTNGFIQGRFTDYTVASGDRFQATVGCQQGATSCYVQYRLDYETGGTIRTFWTWKERYEGLTYNVNLDLSPLAGQTVKFILYINAYGSPVGDQALWGNPVIISKNTPPPPVTTVPPGTTVVPTTAIPPSSCDKAQFIADVTVPDGTVMSPGQLFTKTWRLKNIGQCAWTTAYQLVFVSGAQMGAPNSAAFPMNVAVGQTADFSVNMTAPTAAGSYRGYWMFKNANGQLFGIGSQGNKSWWVDIKVSGTVTPGTPTSTPTATATGPTPTKPANSAYDFSANACFASWFSGAGGIDCTAQTPNAKGYVVNVSNPQYENGGASNQPGLLTVPQAIQDGYIQGIYPPFRVQTGDRFRAIIGCQYGATNCYVGYRLDYQTGNDPIRTYWGPFRERYDQLNYTVDLDLSPLAGKDVKFILTVLALGTPTGDLPMWIGPYIYRVGASSSVQQSAPAVATTAVAGTPVPTTAVPTTPVGSSSTAGTPATSTTPGTPAASTSAYQNTKYDFKFALPAGAAIVSQTDNIGRVDLPIVTPGTNLKEKYILVTATEGKDPCVTTDMEGGTAIVSVTINGTTFSKQTGQGVGAGNIYDWTSYATTKNNACIILTFVMHSTNPDNTQPTATPYNQAQEGAVIDTVMNTYGPATQ
ncbi:MAG: NBR1-Ig-like domain-containing protein [Bacteroidota bacterium]